MKELLNNAEGNYGDVDMGLYTEDELDELDETMVVQTDDIDSLGKALEKFKQGNYDIF